MLRDEHAETLVRTVLFGLYGSGFHPEEDQARSVEIMRSVCRYTYEHSPARCSHAQKSTRTVLLPNSAKEASRQLSVHVLELDGLARVPSNALHWQAVMRMLDQLLQLQLREEHHLELFRAESTFTRSVQSVVTRFPRIHMSPVTL